MKKKLTYKRIIKIILLLAFYLSSCDKINAQIINKELKSKCFFSNDINMTCFMFIKEAEVFGIFNNDESKLCNTSKIQPLDSMCYAMRIFELDTNTCKFGFTLQSTGFIIPNSEQYLVHYYPATHIYTLKTGYQLMVSFDEKVNVDLAEKLLTIRSLTDADTLNFIKKRRIYSCCGMRSEKCVLVQIGDKYMKILKGNYYTYISNNEYEKYFRNYSKEREDIFNKRRLDMLEQLK